MQDEHIRLQQIGARVLAMANDLKRTPAALAAELQLAEEKVAAVIDGTASLENANTLVAKMTEIYPIHWHDVWLDRDDTDGGVAIMRAGTSATSSRIFDRPDAKGRLAPYYDYRDTATSRASPIKPEWIAPLRLVGDANPYNPEVVLNKGHLLHQITFFIGPVNFYWEIDGVRHCAEMSTGDSNFITPFIPHSFSKRSTDEPSFIVAVTYGALVRRALSDLARIEPTLVDQLAGDVRDETIFAVRLRRIMAEECLTDQDVLAGLESEGASPSRAALLLEGALPTLEEVGLLARILEVRPKDLLIETLEPLSAVTVARRASPRMYPSSHAPAYEIRPLARLASQPHVRAAEIIVRSELGETLRHHLHQYIYNFGDAPARFAWGEGRETLLAPGDSACCEPMVPHSFSRMSDTLPRLLVVKVPGALTQEALDEYATFDVTRRPRAHQESSRWF